LGFQNCYREKKEGEEKEKEEEGEEKEGEEKEKEEKEKEEKEKEKELLPSVDPKNIFESDKVFGFF